MPSPKANILVAFYSRDGSVEALAKAVSEGAREAGAEVRLRRVPDLVSPDVMAKVPGWEERSRRMLAEYGAPTHGDVEWADGIIFGTPTRFGNTSAELKAFIDSLATDGRVCMRNPRNQCWLLARLLSKVLWRTVTLNTGWSRVPVMRMGKTVPEPPFSKKGSSAFRRTDFAPVASCESFA